MGCFSNTWAVDARGCHCCQRSTPKWLKLITRAELLFLKMLWTKFSNLTKSSCGDTAARCGHWLEDIIFWRWEFVYMLHIKYRMLHLMISLFTFSKELWSAKKCVQKHVQQDRVFSIESTASALMSGNDWRLKQCIESNQIRKDI